MKLAQLFQKNQPMQLAHAGMNEDILKFFNQAPMKGKGLKLKYDRAPDFFKFLEFQSKHYFVFVLYIENELRGMGTLVIRPGMVDGQATFVGYLGDLRIGHDRRATVIWRRFYADLLYHCHEIDEFMGCRHLLTAIIDDNTQAKTALTQGKQKTFQYLPVAPYRMINVLCPIPLMNNNLSKDYIALPLHQEELGELTHFLQRAHQRFQFGYCISEKYNELEFRFKHWSDFGPENIIVIKKHGRIILAAGLWTPSPIKKIIVEEIPWSDRILLSSLGLVTSTPRLHHELKIGYLTFLTFDELLTSDEKISAFRALLNLALKYKKKSGYNFLAFNDFPQNLNLNKALKGFLNFKTSMTLYQVVHKDWLERDTIRFDLPPDFEMSLV